MPLIKQSFLSFTEGNSDKVYVIELVETGNEQCVVRFQYGRRNAQLKEGTKTPVPVSRTEASKIFDALESEKLRKGYISSTPGTALSPATPLFMLDTSSAVTDERWQLMPAGSARSVMQRLHQAVYAPATRPKFPWKLSRIIWKAGEYRIAQAAPYIIRLFSPGNRLHQYSCTWALGRCAAGDPVSLLALRTIFQSHPEAAVAKIAGTGLLQQLAGSEKETFLLHYLQQLPAPLPAAVETGQLPEFESGLQAALAAQPPPYPWLEALYLTSVAKPWMRPALQAQLIKLPLRPNYFRQLRAIFKAAELLDDFDTLSLLALRFEKEPEMFHHNVRGKKPNRTVFIPAIGEAVAPRKELGKPDSRLAYSQKTRWYLNGRMLRKLSLLGLNDDTAYVQLATALLIRYKKEQAAAAYSTHSYRWTGNQYERTETRFPENAGAVFLHLILRGNDAGLSLSPGRRWQETGQPVQTQGLPSSQTTGLGGILTRISDFFSPKKDAAAQPSSLTPENSQPDAALTDPAVPFHHLWQRMPQAYVQLLMEAELDSIHRFAETHLLQHPEYPAIKNRLNIQACIRLLLSPYPIPARFGYRLAKEKYAGEQPDANLVMALLNSIHEEAVQLGKEWTETAAPVLLQQSSFISGLLFARDQAVRSWALSLLRRHPLTPAVREAVVVKAIAFLLQPGPLTPQNEQLVQDASGALLELFGAELSRTGTGVITDLLQHPHHGVLLFALRLLKLRQQHLNGDHFSANFFLSLLQHSYEPVREMGIEILSNLPAGQLLSHGDEIISASLSARADVRQGLRPLIRRLAEQDRSFGIRAVETLLTLLRRKETLEGLHAAISALLLQELNPFLPDAGEKTAFLLQSQYPAAQVVGLAMLNKHDGAASLPLQEVVALGSHENQEVRQWSWNFFRRQPSRIRSEKEEALRLLDSKWQDTRKFARQYFSEQFGPADWTPELLITLADSVKPDVEAYGRELITRFLEAGDGPDYLSKLTQHPSRQMQVFASDYLERFAAGDVEKLRSLDFYFRAVLMQVNKGRLAKSRVFRFLLTEGRQSEAAARAVCAILSEVSATAAVGDKATCIDIMLQLAALYEVDTPLKIKETETRLATHRHG